MHTHVSPFLLPTRFPHATPTDARRKEPWHFFCHHWGVRDSSVLMVHYFFLSLSFQSYSCLFNQHRCPEQRKIFVVGQFLDHFIQQNAKFFLLFIININVCMQCVSFFTGDGKKTGKKPDISAGDYPHICLSCNSCCCRWIDMAWVHVSTIWW